ncbi:MULTISPECIES: PAS domain S-box protein [unclassified Microcoleus]|uniref:PAS domain S-box protein n=1 Tax=unclassified Microcoleus TaxID=2642155 RepID=UPI001D38CABF|nr:MULTISPECIES: PAS domain S-box protein [unclassified Microcoleus]MCC3504788.1 PAS domain S-box protein [Microcoleus sp. PH2017_19_SFW_U_A]TAG65034.1 MAG: PAS domain S-box protein [Oscillatoriales cyanobacterium]MCC3474016.1 PAS domain S-box protein [Microcoleus sp. PH2017_13_LAR_U_A]MCC3483545.1 PAS domain S-box protein [Microcoleus sp. PH2017_14_LAR_D_A]MCC3522677.1 PAS domain S-box protein [Microcoleus sp. PH2017_20_SFW_D_A]
MSRFQVLPLPIKSYSIATFTAGTALLLTTLLLFALQATPAILLLAAAMVGGWYAGLKSAEQELEIERQIISKVTDTTACLIVVLDSRGRIVRFNQACEKTTGYSVAEVLDKYVWDLFLIPEEVEAAQTVFANLNAEVVYSEYQNYWRTKNGSKRFISWSNTVMLGIDGLVEYAIASGIDITDRKLAEIALASSYAKLENRVKQRTAELTVAKEALQAQEERFRCLSSCSPVGIFMADFEGRYTYANPRTQAICGLSLAELLGDGWENCIHPEDRDRVLSRWLDYTRELGEYAIEYRLQTAEGIVRWINVGSAPMFSDCGELIGHVGTVRDVTERQQTQAALSSSEQQLRTLLENTPDVIIRTDKELRYIYVNEAVARTQGKPISFFLGKTSQEIGMPPELCQRWDETLRKVLETGREEVIEFQAYSTDGIRSYQSRVVPEFDKDGVPESALIVARDITELKLTESQRLQLATEQAAREKAQIEQQRSAFLAEVSKILAAAFDGETVLQNVAELAVNSVADGCCIHLTETDSKVRKVAVAHAEASTVDTINKLRVCSPIAFDAVNGYPLVIRTGKSQLIAEVDEEILAAAAENAAEIEMLRAAKLSRRESLNIGSHACVPLKARGRVMGAITCFTSKLGRRYSAEDMAMLEDLAYRVAIALDNARLYAEAQQALAQTSQSFALIDSLLEASPLAICFLDREMRFIRINQVLAELNGLPAEQHLGQDYRQLLPESAAEFAPIIQQVLETGEPVLNVEVSGEHGGRPGYFGYWLANYYPVKNERGEIIGAGIIIADVTAAKQTELALRESEMRFRSVVDSNMIGIGFWEAGGEITEANNALLDMIGYTREDLISGKIHWSNITPPEYAELDRAALAQVAASGSCEPFEKEYIRKDGTRFPVFVGAGHLQGCTDKGSFFVVDITDRKQAQNQIRENEIRISNQLAELDLVYNTTPVGLCFLDTNLRYIRMNECLAAINGRTIADHIGRTVREAIPELANLVEPIYRQVLATQTPVLDMELKAETLQQPGVVRDWQVSFYPVIDESGTLLGVSSVVAEITDRNQAKRVIQQSEALFRRLLDSNIFGVAIGDFTGRIAYANDSLLNMVGYTRLDVLSGQMRWDNMTPSEYLHLDARAAGELRASGVATPFKKEYIRKDGSRVPVLMGATTLCPDKGEPETIVGFYIDLTEISRVEAELKNNQQRLQIAQQAGKIGTFEWNVQTGELACTPELEALYGLPAGGFQSSYQNLLAMVHPDDRTFTEQQVLAAATNGEELNIEFRICRSDSSVAWIACRAKVFQDERGLPLRTIGVNVDITDRKQAEEARSQINQTLEALIQACPLAITVFGAEDGIVKMWNPAAERIFGWPESEAVGKFLPSVPPDKREEFMENLKGIRAGNAIAGMETQRQRKDGTSIDIGLWATPVRDAKGNINCMSIVADISDRKQVEAELAQLLDREQAARAEAEAINRRKDEFLATLSHELRTPLNAILGWAQMLRTRPYTPDSLACGLEAIERQSRVQTQLVEDLLDVSRIIQGKLVLKPGWFVMTKTIEVALNCVSFAAQAKSVTVSSEFDPAISLMWGDAQRLQQVVSNLLTNAVKFTPSGGTVQLRLSAVAVANSPSPNYIQIIVSDTGKGISAEFLPYVFDRFRQADGSITKAYGGLGLGLAIVEHLVELHGGTVRAESPGEGLGATFTVMLPLKQRRSQQPQLIEERQLAAVSPGILAGLKVLVVDDEPDNREFLVLALKQLGALAMAAASAQEAIDILQQSPPDILVSDIGMPVEDGYSLIRKVRSSESDKIKRLAAVALTAYASEQDRHRAIEAGYDEHLAKPIDSARFATVLAQLKTLH